jgi:hypothetical protein
VSEHYILILNNGKEVSIEAEGCEEEGSAEADYQDVKARYRHH